MEYNCKIKHIGNNKNSNLQCVSNSNNIIHDQKNSCKIKYNDVIIFFFKKRKDKLRIRNREIGEG